MNAARGPARVPVQVADCFLLALDAFMRRTGQGAQVTQSVLELERAPDLPRLRDANARLLEKFPLLAARLHRDWRTLVPYWNTSRSPGGCLPVGLWREAGSPGALGREAREIADANDAIRQFQARPLAEKGIHFNARLDVLEDRDGRCRLVLSWSHIILDGKGAELLLAELGRLCEGVDVAGETSEPPPAPLTFREKILKTKPAINHLAALAKTGVRSLSGPKPRASAGRSQVIALDAAQSARVQERVRQIAGGLFPFVFYIACAARAHDRVFRHRGEAPGAFVTSVPVQRRRRGAHGPILHNQMAVLFFGLERSCLDSIESATAEGKRQFADMMRAKLDESFSVVLELMMRLPAWLFMFVVRAQFKGEIASFFHSHTGPFAPELVELAGARVANAYHLPCLGTPPGTGLFFGEHNGRVNMTLSWREGCLTAEERRLMVGQAIEDLLGEPCPELCDAGM